MKISENNRFIIMPTFYLVNMEGSKLTYLEYQVQLVLNGRTREKRTSGGHFVENAAHAPHVDGRGVLGRAKQDIWRSVPQSYHFVRVGFGRNWLCTCKTKIGQLELIEKKIDHITSSNHFSEVFFWLALFSLIFWIYNTKVRSDSNLKNEGKNRNKKMSILPTESNFFAFWSNVRK